MKLKNIFFPFLFSGKEFETENVKRAAPYITERYANNADKQYERANICTKRNLNINKCE